VQQHLTKRFQGMTEAFDDQISRLEDQNVAIHKKIETIWAELQEIPEVAVQGSRQ
jgi:hypothetical protein